jgi:hypothetical protein
MPGKAKMKPKGARGRAAVKRLGRTYKTGNFDRGVKAIVQSGKSKESAAAIMGAAYWREVAKAQGKKPAKGPAKKGK